MINLNFVNYRLTIDSILIPSVLIPRRPYHLSHVIPQDISRLHFVSQLSPHASNPNHPVLLASQFEKQGQKATSYEKRKKWSAIELKTLL
jgi:hypothetical protein